MQAAQELKKMKPVTREDDIEFIIRNIPGALLYLIKKGVCGISCGETISGTLESVAKSREFSEISIVKMVKDLNNILIKENV